MKQVYLFEDKGCHPSKVEALVSFLRRRLDGAAQITAFDLGRPEGQVPVPPRLRLHWTQGADCLPALVVDAVVVTEGWVPNFRDAVRLIDSGQPAPESMRPAARADPGCSCGPDGCC